MPWFKVDDSFATHPKVLSIPRGAPRLRAIGLWTTLGSWCAKHLTDGRVPRHMIEESGSTIADAQRLVTARLWTETTDGYAFHDWTDWQPTRASVLEDRDAAKHRMREARARKRRATQRSPEHTGNVRPNDDRTSGEVRSTPTRPDPTTAAAAADAGANKATDQPDDLADAPDAGGSAATLPGPIDVLRSRLQAHTPLRALRFDTLRPDQTATLLELIDRHGDQTLVDTALRTCRNPPPVHVGAFIGTWAALPPPGQTLALVRSRCETHDTELTASGQCSGCAADQKAAQ